MNALRFADPLLGKLLTGGEPGFVVAEWQDPGGGFDPPRWIAPLHLHRNDDEAWYVLEGTLRVRVGDEDVELRPGCGVMVPRGTPHAYWNPGKDRTRYLLIMTSRIRQLIQAIHSTKERTPAIMKALFEEYDSELLG